MQRIFIRGNRDYRKVSLRDKELKISEDSRSSWEPELSKIK